MTKTAFKKECDDRREAGLLLFHLHYDDRQAAKDLGGIWDARLKCWLMPDIFSLHTIGAKESNGEKGPYWTMMNGDGKPKRVNVEEKQEAQGDTRKVVYVVGDTAYTSEAQAEIACSKEGLAVEDYWLDTSAPAPVKPPTRVAPVTEKVAPRPVKAKAKSAQHQEGDECPSCADDHLDRNLKCFNCGFSVPLSSL